MPMALRETHTELNFQYMRVHGKSESLIGFLMRRFPYFSLETWAGNVERGLVLVNGGDCRPDQVLKNGQTVTYLRPDHLEPPVDPRFELIHEDADVVAVGKSGDIPTSPSGKYFKNTLIHVVADAIGVEKLYTLHRLDRETSGVIVFAKHKEAARILAAQFQEKTIRKRYSAVLRGRLPAAEIYVTAPLGVAVDSGIRVKQGVNAQGKLSQTRFLAREPLGADTLADVRPLTGRTHQIRVHAALAGHPVLGDKLYGVEESAFIRWTEGGEAYLDEVGATVRRQMLHAAEITVAHPATGAEITFRADESIMLEHLSAPRAAGAATPARRAASAAPPADRPGADTTTP